jgi:hypothetical protein
VIGKRLSLGVAFLLLLRDPEYFRPTLVLIT